MTDLLYNLFKRKILKNKNLFIIKKLKKINT